MPVLGGERTLGAVPDFDFFQALYHFSDCEIDSGSGGRMTRFEYVAIFNGIFVALALENIASSFHKLLEAGGRVRWHWMAPTNAIGSAIATIGSFWLWWAARDKTLVDATVFTRLPSATELFLLYLACAAALPDEVPETGIDLREFYFSRRQQYWSIVGATALLVACASTWAMVRHNFDPQLIRIDAPILVGTLVAAAIAASMIFVRASWWHALGIMAMTSGVIFIYGPTKI